MSIYNITNINENHLFTKDPIHVLAEEYGINEANINIKTILSKIWNVIIKILKGILYPVKIFGELLKLLPKLLQKLSLKAMTISQKQVKFDGIVYKNKKLSYEFIRNTLEYQEFFSNQDSSKYSYKLNKFPEIIESCDKTLNIVSNMFEVMNYFIKSAFKSEDSAYYYAVDDDGYKAIKATESEILRLKKELIDQLPGGCRKLSKYEMSYTYNYEYCNFDYPYDIALAFFDGNITKVEKDIEIFRKNSTNLENNCKKQISDMYDTVNKYKNRYGDYELWDKNGNINNSKDNYIARLIQEILKILSVFKDDAYDIFGIYEFTIMRIIEGLKNANAFNSLIDTIFRKYSEEI